MIIDEGVDLSARELCPDGACIGVIGADGNCKECGTTLPDPAAEKSAGTEQIASIDKPAWTDSDDGSPPDFASRVLCADGNCIGVVGQDGRCRACQRTSAQVEADALAALAAAKAAAEAAAEAAEKQANAEEAPDDDASASTASDEAKHTPHDV